MDEGAPLVATPDAPLPDGARAEWFAGAGGARLRAALFPAPGSGGPRGSVVVSPGRTEPIEKYFEVAERLRGRGWTVLVHDWRGQGLSRRLLADRRLGHAVGHADFVADYGALLTAFGDRLPRPWLALGHSMGGCLTLLALALGESRFSGAILSAPMLGIRTGKVPRPVARALARVMTAIGRGSTPVAREPGPRGDVAFADNVLTHDPARYARNAAQIVACSDLGLGEPTWGWLDFAFSSIALLEHGAGVPRIAVPLTVVAAGQDALVDNAGLRRITARAPGARYLEIAGAFHEILQETGDLQAPFWAVFDDLAETLDQGLAAGRSAQSASSSR